MTQRDLKMIETLTDLAGDTRERADHADGGTETSLHADADRLETLLAFYKASLPAD